MRDLLFLSHRLPFPPNKGENTCVSRTALLAAASCIWERSSIMRRMPTIPNRSGLRQQLLCPYAAALGQAIGLSALLRDEALSLLTSVAPCCNVGSTRR
jgi:hypothetical protein